MSMNIFFCYAHEDEALLTQLKRHLSLLQREDLIEGWDEQEVHAGEEWEEETKL